MEERKVDIPPEDFDHWYQSLYRTGLNVFNIALLVEYFRQPKITRRSKQWFLDELRLFFKPEVTMKHVELLLRQLNALGYLVDAGRHDERGQFCGIAFSLCAEPPPIPSRSIITLDTSIKDVRRMHELQPGQIPSDHLLLTLKPDFVEVIEWLSGELKSGIMDHVAPCGPLTLEDLYARREAALRARQIASIQPAAPPRRRGRRARKSKSRIAMPS